MTLDDIIMKHAKPNGNRDKGIETVARDEKQHVVRLHDDLLIIDGFVTVQVPIVKKFLYNKRKFTAVFTPITCKLAQVVLDTQSYTNSPAFDYALNHFGVLRHRPSHIKFDGCELTLAKSETRDAETNDVLYIAQPVCKRFGIVVDEHMRMVRKHGHSSMRPSIKKGDVAKPVPKPWLGA